MQAERLILHIDADAFFASVEQALRPELKGLPVIVGASSRGVVSAASYEARRFGVRSAMPVTRARRLCPRGIFLAPNFSAYSLFSKQMFSIIREFSPLVEVTSVDEGYVDLSGTLRLHKAPPWEIAHRILLRIRKTLGINVSGGLASNRCWAKLAAGIAKPNGLLFLDSPNAFVLMQHLPVESIPGVGARAEAILKQAGIHTLSDLVTAGKQDVHTLLGKWGERLVEMAQGRENRPIEPDGDDTQKSYSKERTLEKDTTSRKLIRSVARELGEKLAARLRSEGVGASTVTLKIRYSDFTDTSKSLSRNHPMNTNSEILIIVDRLLAGLLKKRAQVRQVGVKLSGIGLPIFQENLFDAGSEVRIRRDRALDDIRSKFGFGSVMVSG